MASLFSSLFHIAIPSQPTDNFLSSLLSLLDFSPMLMILLFCEWIGDRPSQATRPLSQTITDPHAMANTLLLIAKILILSLQILHDFVISLAILQGSLFGTDTRLSQPYRAYLPSGVFNFISAIALKLITTNDIRQCRFLKTLLSSPITQTFLLHWPISRYIVHFLLRRNKVCSLS